MENIDRFSKNRKPAFRDPQVVFLAHTSHPIEKVPLGHAN
jgi:hypothetical protein